MVIEQKSFNTVKQINMIGYPHKLLVGLVCIGLCFTLLALPAHNSGVRAQSGSATTITLSPTPAAINGCEIAEVRILINDVVDLYAADVRLSFNPAVMEVVDDLPGDYGVNLQTAGSMLTNLWVTKNEANNTAGTIWFAATQLYPAEPKDGSGVLAAIHFRAKTAGASALAFTYTKLADSEGVQIPATSVNGSVSSTTEFAPTLSISKVNADDVRLSWTAASGASSYSLYRVATPESPYFTPIGPAYHVSTGLSYLDAGALGDVDVQHYYTLQASCSNGFKSGSSNRVAEYEYALRSSAASNFNDIAMVLETPAILSASALETHIGSGVMFIAQYKQDTQSLQTYIPGIDSTDFSLTTGQFVYVITDSTAPSSVAFVGGVPAAGSISFSLASGDPAKYNFLSIPLDQGHLTMASDVVSDLGSGVIFLLRFNIETQSFQPYIPGIDSTDFPLTIGEPFGVILEAGAAGQWP